MISDLGASKEGSRPLLYQPKPTMPQQLEYLIGDGYCICIQTNKAIWEELSNLWFRASCSSVYL